MRRLFIIAFGLIGVLLFIVTHLPKVNELKVYPTPSIEQEKRNLQIALDATKLNDNAFNREKRNELRIKLVFFDLELLRRAFYLDLLAYFAFGGAIALSLMGVKIRKKEKQHLTQKRVRVAEALPTESYVDDAEFFRRKEEGFPSKERALEWYQTDPLRTCSYCGSENMKPINNQQDTVQLVTFYKKVPEGAKDLRIVLGAYWFVKAVPELQCETCKHRIVR